MMVREPRFRSPFLDRPRALRTPMVCVTLRHLAGPKRRGESVPNRWGVIAGRVGLGTVHVGAAHPRVAELLSRLENKNARQTDTKV